ncbi:hypothetical protein A8B82_10700 [Sulfitobacter sp. EhC04]|uniref:hypothetical protein n=1 Tax=Sulfitobacter sp. EhC04 TaxID=1849168 RepID=UPI0007F41442|nr:hypothetical protein [Sulfitobacter sp. EhC04]OAN78204.1 hypothetical protein A8B82_10700 [Sulfitobacter sp. EhC04]
MSSRDKHLDFIQATISRLAQNSFQIKGWTVLSVSAVLAIAFRESSSGAAILALIPTIMFWFLDSYYLALERIYRSMFDEVRQRDEGKIDFNMIVPRGAVSIAAVFECMWSINNTIYYPTIVVILIITAAFF